MNKLPYLLAIFLIFGHCKSDNIPEQNNLRIQINRAPDHFLPFMGRKYESTLLQSLQFYSLTGLDPISTEEQPFLASEMLTLKESNDSLYVDIQLNPKARWSNGTPLSSKDLEFALKILVTPGLNSLYSPLYTPIETIEIKTDRDIRLVIGSCGLALEQLLGYLKPFPAAFLDPEKAFEKYTFNQIKSWEQSDVPEEIAAIIKTIQDFPIELAKKIPVSGPYQLDTLTTDYCRLQRVPNYWGNQTQQKHLRAYPEILTFHFVENTNTIKAMLRSEEIDVVSNLPASEIKTLEADALFSQKYALKTKEVPVYYYFAMNMTNAKLAPLEVRRALSYTLNLDNFIEKVLDGNAIRLSSPLHPNNIFYDASLKPMAFDPAKAKKILEDNGWGDADKDGILDKGNIELSINILLSNNSKDGRDLAEIWAQSAKQAGIEIVPTFKSGKYIQNALKEKNFDILSTGASSELKYSDLTERWSTSGRRNYTGYSNPTVDSLVLKIRTGCLDDSQYDKAYKAIQAEIYKDVPALFLFSKSEFFIHSKRYTPPGILLESPYFHVQYMKTAS